MKKTVFAQFFLLFYFATFGQAYIGEVLKPVNFRTGPGNQYAVQKTLAPGTQIFVISSSAENSYYNIIDIGTNAEGFVHKAYVRLVEQVEENENGLFTPIGQSSGYNPELEVINSTSRQLTLLLGNRSYEFSPREKKKLTVSPGELNYRASAPGVIPNIGRENFQDNTAYVWEFYIETRRR